MVRLYHMYFYVGLLVLLAADEALGAHIGAGIHGGIDPMTKPCEQIPSDCSSPTLPVADIADIAEEAAKAAGVTDARDMAQATSEAVGTSLAGAVVDPANSDNLLQDQTRKVQALQAALGEEQKTFENSKKQQAMVVQNAQLAKIHDKTEALTKQTETEADALKAKAQQEECEEVLAARKAAAAAVEQVATKAAAKKKAVVAEAAQRKAQKVVQSEKQAKDAVTVITNSIDRDNGVAPSPCSQASAASPPVLAAIPTLAAGGPPSAEGANSVGSVSGGV